MLSSNCKFWEITPNENIHLSITSSGKKSCHFHTLLVRKKLQLVRLWLNMWPFLIIVPSKEMLSTWEKEIKGLLRNFTPTLSIVTLKCKAQI